jgi:1,4-dihydroxy-2-naphthoate octaprenyltransferase
MITVWLEATRPKTLPAAVAPVLVATALAWHAGGMRWQPALICLFFALLVQIGTNFANDYLDGIRGTDTAARLGPQRAVASGLIAPGVMCRAALTTLGVAFVLGLSLIFYGGPWLLLVGLASVGCAWAYTGGPLPLAYNGLGDIFVVLFFGFVAVGFTFFLQTGYVSSELFPTGLAIGLIINNLLVVNNYRDVEEDRAARKRTLVVLLGRRWARIQYGLSLLCAAALPLWLVQRGYGISVIPASLPCLYGFFLLRQLGRAERAADYLVILRGSGRLVILYAAVLTLGIGFSALGG